MNHKRFSTIPLLVFLFVASLPTAAHAHLFPKQRATIKIVENTASLVVAVPVSALQNVDDDNDGLLSPWEVQRHKKEIQDQFIARFHISGDGEGGESVLTWVVPPQHDGLTAESDYVVLLHRVNFRAPPTTLNIQTDLFGNRAGESRLTVTARQGGTFEVATLDADTPSHRFSWTQEG